MKAPARVVANRKNARSNTGPWTRPGKLRTSKNARRHGLSVPLPPDPWLEAEVEELAYLIDEGSADSIRHQHARAIAVELMELRRIRAARENLFLDQVKRIKPLSAAREVRACIDFYKKRPNPDIVYMLARKAGLDTELRPVSFEDGIGVLARDIARLDRYEARALSRRRRAIQLFHLAV